MTLRIPAKVLLHVWSYDFYDMTLSTGKQRRHMIKAVNLKTYFPTSVVYIYGQFKHNFQGFLDIKI